MRDGLKIYACSGFGVGTAPQDFTYWLDNTETITNTKAVNSLLAKINFLAAKLCYDTSLSNKDVLTALNLIDLYTVCLYGAEQYHGVELERYGRIVAQLAEDGAFGYESLDNDERDNNLDDLISQANTHFNDGENPSVQNDTYEWFVEDIVSADYVGLNEEQIEAVREVIDSQNAVSGSTTQDAGKKLFEAGGYYLYLYLTRKEAIKIGKTVDSKRSKEDSVYNFVLKGYDEIYNGKDDIDQVIYSGICRAYGHTPEYVVKEILGKKQEGVGEIAAIITAVSSLVTVLVTAIVSVIEIALKIKGAEIQTQYSVPEDPEWGTPGAFDDSDLAEIEKMNKKSSVFSGLSNLTEENKTLLGVAAAALLLFFGLRN